MREIRVLAHETGVMFQITGRVDKAYANYFLELTYPDGRTEVFRDLQMVDGPKFARFISRESLSDGIHALTLKGQNLGEEPVELLAYRCRIRLQ